MGWNLRIAVFTVLGGAVVVGALLVGLNVSDGARSGASASGVGAVAAGVSSYSLNSITSGGMPASAADGSVDWSNLPRWEVPDPNANTVMGMLANSRNDNGIAGSIVTMGTPEACPDGTVFLGTIIMLTAKEQIDGGLVDTPGAIAVDVLTGPSGQVAMDFYSCPA